MTAERRDGVDESRAPDRPRERRCFSTPEVNATRHKVQKCMTAELDASSKRQNRQKSIARGRGYQFLLGELQSQTRPHVAVGSRASDLQPRATEWGTSGGRIEVTHPLFSILLRVRYVL